jgi:hypothetical protein
VTIQDLDTRRQLLERICRHQASINMYVQKTQGRREVVTNISIISSTIAAALVVGPAVGRDSFAEAVQKGLGFEKDSTVWGILCFASVIVNLVAAISAGLSKSNDPTERISTAQACNAALEALRADVEFGKLPVKAAVGEYGQIVARVLFVPEDLAENTDLRDGKRSEVILPSMAIAFGCVILIATIIGLFLGAQPGVAAPAAAQLSLSTPQVKDGATYSVTASGFLPREEVQFSWTGPTNGVMGTFSADSSGSTTHGEIRENDPPGTYVITAIGQTSGRTASTGLTVQPGS